MKMFKERPNKPVSANTIIYDVFEMINMTSDFSTCVLLNLQSFVVISSLTQSQLSCFSHDRVTSLKCQYIGPSRRAMQSDSDEWLLNAEMT